MKNTSTLIKPFLVILFFAFCLPVISQTTSYEELEFEADSVSAPYKPAGKNYAFIRSKRGTGGVAKTSRADSVKALPVTEIVLVFSELNASAIADREEANKERWENLLKTYPELFQFSTTYKSLCQCKNGGDTASFKPKQGFYVYFTADEPKAAEVAPVKKTEEKRTPTKELAVTDKPSKAKEAPVKTSEEPVRPVKEKKEKKEKETVKKTEKPVEVKEEPEAPVEVVKEMPKKRTGYTKPKRAKDPKACRPACYGSGDEDLNTFFKENITLSKKQRHHGKSLTSVVRLQLNFDGSIKKEIITGADEVLNQQVSGAIKLMDLWNPTVKGGVTIKSEVKITLEYDKDTKSMKASEVAVTPRPAPKCVCTSDADIFGSE